MLKYTVADLFVYSAQFVALRNDGTVMLNHEFGTEQIHVDNFQSVKQSCLSSVQLGVANTIFLINFDSPKAAQDFIILLRPQTALAA